MNISITPYSIPPLISLLFLFSRGIVALFSRKKERLWCVFAFFCFVMAAVSLFAFMITLSRSQIFIFYCARLELFFAFLSLSFANFYANWLTGRSDRINIFGLEISIKTGLRVGVSVYVILLTLLFFTKLIIKDIVLLEEGGARVGYGPLMYAAILVFLTGAVINLLFLISAYRESQDRSFREYVRLNITGFHLIFSPAILLLFVLPMLGLQTQVLTFFAFPVAVMVFYVAIVRYQFAQLDELNISLEKKVEERTSELMQAQSRLIQSEKMASLGQLVAGVAHEVNNPIGAVKSMIQSSVLATEKLKSIMDEKPDENKKQMLARIFKVFDDAYKVMTEGMQRIIEIVKTLKSFAMLDEAELQKVDIHEGLEDTLKLIQHEISPSIKIIKNYGNIPDISCFPAQLNQVFLNVLINAIQSIDDHGEIRIITCRENDNVSVDIKDTGVGIPEENMKKIFDPGFTTKGVGVGTGLGLSICYQIIQDHKGEISVKSRVGDGTTFTIILPIDMK